MKNNLIIRGGADFSGFRKELTKAQGNLKGFQTQTSMMSKSCSRMGSFIKTAFAIVGVGAIVKFGKESIQASNDIENAMIGLKSIIEGQGRSFQDANKFIKGYISDGLIPATEAVTAYKNLAMRGYTDTQITTTLQALKDSASFGRQASLSLGQAVSSATEGLKNENSILVDNAGVTKNVSMMWEEYAKSIGVGAKSLTKQQKIQAEVTGIMSETRFQTGDAIKVTNTYSGSILKLQYGLNNMKIAFGNFLKPIVANVIPIINNTITTFTKFFNIMAQVSTLLFNKKTFSTKQSQAQAGAIGEATDNQNALTNATNETAKASKKAQAGFDELNVLSENSADSTGGEVPTADAGGAIGGLGEVGSDVTVSSNVQGVVDTIMSIFAPLKAINLDNLKTSFDNFKVALEPFTSAIFEGLKWAWDNLLVPLATWAIEDALPKFLEVFASALNLLKAVIEPFMPLGIWLWEEFLKPLAQWTGGLIITALDSLKIALDNITTWCVDNKETIQNTTITVVAFFATWKATQLLAFIQTSGGVVGALGVLKTAIWSVTGAKLADNAQTVIATVKNAGAFLASIVNGTVALVKQAVAWVSLTIAKYADEAAMAGVSIATVAWSSIASSQLVMLISSAAQWVINTALKVADTVAQWAMIAATTAWNVLCVIATAVTTAFGVAVAFLTSPIGLVILAVGALIAIIVLLVKNWDWVKETAIKVWDGIKATWEKVAEWFNTSVIQPLGSFFSGLWDGIAYGAKMLWWGIEVGVISMANFVIGVINDMVEGALAPFNLLIKAMNLIPKVNIPLLEFSIPSIKLPPIPKLANGAVIPPNREFMAVLGDQKHGTNIETPLDTMVQAFKMANTDSGDSGREITIKFTGGMSELVRMLKPEIDKETSRRGTKLIMGTA